MNAIEVGKTVGCSLEIAYLYEFCRLVGQIGFCASRPQGTHLMQMSARGRLGGVGVLPNPSPLSFSVTKWFLVQEPVGDCLLL